MATPASPEMKFLGAQKAALDAYSASITGTDEKAVIDLLASLIEQGVKRLDPDDLDNPPDPIPPGPDDENSLIIVFQRMLAGASFDLIETTAKYEVTVTK